MDLSIRNISLGIKLLLVFCGTFFGGAEFGYALSINPQNVQALAIYGGQSNFGTGLQPNAVSFTITDPVLINDLLSGINFSEELYCETMLARKNATVYLKFKDGSVEFYDLFGSWSHFSKDSFRASCYFISETAQVLFEANAK